MCASQHSCHQCWGPRSDFMQPICHFGCICTVADWQVRRTEFYGQLETSYYSNSNTKMKAWGKRTSKPMTYSKPIWYCVCQQLQALVVAKCQNLYILPLQENQRPLKRKAWGLQRSKSDQLNLSTSKQASNMHFLYLQWVVQVAYFW